MSKIFLPSLISIALLLAAGRPGRAAEQIFMDGKPVPKATYEAVLLLKQGVNQLHDNNNRGAVASLSQAAELAPEMAEIQHNLGIALGKSGRTEEAIQALEKARAINPNLDSTWMSLGGLYQTEGRLQDAVDAYNEFLKRFPKDPNTGKIQSIVKGLEKEIASAGPGGNNPEAPDYVKEVTRKGTFRWDSAKMPLRVHIPDGQAAPGYRPEFAEILKTSFTDWQDASGGAVRFAFVDNKADSDIEVSWTGDPKTLKSIAEAGEAELFTTKKGIVRGTIALLTVPLMESLPLTDNRMRNICLHEIGHVLGMAGHTTNPHDAMFYSIGVGDVWKDLTKRDSNTIVKLYQTPDAPISYAQGE